VRILDHSVTADDKVIEEVGGFATLMQANEFARRYVRDSIERCRIAGTRGDEVVEAWLRWGEDAEVAEAGDAGWRSTSELEDFADTPAEGEERNWRVLDPRRRARDEASPD
jgi:hypothetical protein